MLKKTKCLLRIIQISITWRGKEFIQLRSIIPRSNRYTCKMNTVIKFQQLNSILSIKLLKQYHWILLVFYSIFIRKKLDTKNWIVLIYFIHYSNVLINSSRLSYLFRSTNRYVRWIKHLVCMSVFTRYKINALIAILDLNSKTFFSGVDWVSKYNSKNLIKIQSNDLALISSIIIASRTHSVICFYSTKQKWHWRRFQSTNDDNHFNILARFVRLLFCQSPRISVAC